MPPRRRGGRRSTRSAAQRSPSPPLPEQSDSEMPDAPSDAGTQQEAPQDADEVEDEAAEDEAAEEGDNEEESSPAPASPGPTPRTRTVRAPEPAAPPVKRRPGRPPKYPRPQVDGSDREGSDATPRRRGGFRGGRGFGGGRWKNKNLQRQQAMPVDKDGVQLEIENDEAKMDEDPEGEKKVDTNGRLQGGREYRVRTFTIDGKEDRLYMLSTEPARCIGFRDSYLFFQKHRMLYKIILTDEEKMDLIERNLMPHSYKGRSIGVVTARSVFREFGAKIVIGGRKIVDDYRVADMRAEGDVEGELAVPEDVLPKPGEEYNRNQYVAWHGASQVYHTNAPSIPMPGNKAIVTKRKVTVTGSNWMLEHAREASRFNSFLATARRDTLEGIYDIYTNKMHYPSIMQPTHARWEQVEDEAATKPVQLEHSPRHTSSGLPNGIHDADDDTAPLGNGDGQVESASPPQATTSTPSSRFPPISIYQLRNFATVDTESVVPRYSGLGAPGPWATERTLPGASPGLSAVPADVIASLPPSCRAAFEEARRDELRWRSQWGTESTDGLRGDLRVSYLGA